MAVKIPQNILNQVKLATGQSLDVPWENDYKNLASQLQSIQSNVDIYKGGSPLEANQHIYNIASTLARDYGIGSISDIGVRPVDERIYTPSERVEVQEGSPYLTEATSELTGKKVDEFYNKKTGKVIPANKFASEGAGEGYSNYNLQAVPDGKGGVLAVPVQQYSLSGASEFIAENKDILIVAAVALQVVPGLGQAVGYAVLGAGDVIAGAALAGEISAAIGISSVTAASVVTAVGSATIAASVTAAQGGTVEDVLKAGAAAGSAVGVNFAAGGGITGAAAGSAVGTAIQGGDAERVLVNAFAAGVGAGVQDAMPNNPDAGKIIGTAARTYISTGGNVDKTLLSTTATAIGTLDQPTQTSRQVGSSSSTTRTPTSQETSTETQPASAAQTAEPITVSETPIKLGDTYYYPMSNGGAAYTDDKGVNRYISASEFEADKSTFGVSDPSTVVPPAGVATTTFDPQTIVATSPDVSPVVTDLDLVNKVAEQKPTVVDPKELERVIIQGQRESNVSPVVTDVSQTEFEKKFINETVPAPVSTGPELQEVTIQETVPRPVDPVNFEQKTIQETVPKVSEVGTDVPDPTTELETEEPDKLKEDPKTVYPTVTNVPSPARPGRQPTITGASPARLLADALAAYRPAGAIEGAESGKERQNVWNEKSLRLKDALGL